MGTMARVGGFKGTKKCVVQQITALSLDFQQKRRDPAHRGVFFLCHLVRNCLYSMTSKLNHSESRAVAARHQILDQSQKLGEYSAQNRKKITRAKCKYS